MKNRNVLITGGAGFIGSSLIHELIKDNNDIVIDNFDSYNDPSIKKDNIEPFIDKAYKVLGYKPSIYINKCIKEYVRWKKEE